MRVGSPPLYLVSGNEINEITMTIFLQDKSELLVAFPERLCYIWFIQIFGPRFSACTYVKSELFLISLFLWSIAPSLLSKKGKHIYEENEKE